MSFPENSGLDRSYTAGAPELRYATTTRVAAGITQYDLLRRTPMFLNGQPAPAAWENLSSGQTLTAVQVAAFVNGDHLALPPDGMLLLGTERPFSVPITAGGTLLSTIAGGIPPGANYAILLNSPDSVNSVYYTTNGTAPVAVTSEMSLIPGGRGALDSAAEIAAALFIAANAAENIAVKFYVRWSV